MVMGLQTMQNNEKLTDILKLKTIKIHAYKHGINIPNKHPNPTYKKSFKKLNALRNKRAMC